MSSGAGRFLFAGLGERGLDLAGDVAFQAADDLALLLPSPGRRATLALVGWQ